KDEEAEDMNVHLYRSMIGSLMYLTASRPDIMFVVCACVRHSPFNLEAFSNSDYAGASLDRKSTTGGCEFLGKRLISWQCKKQTIVANSTTEAEYVAAANYCGTTEISQSSGPIHLVVDETVYKEWKDRIERATTTTSSLEAEQDSGLRLHLNKSNDPSLSRVNTLRSGEDNMKLKELMELCTKLPERELCDIKTDRVNWLNLLLPVLVYAARHSLTTVRHKLMLRGITSYCWTSAKVKIVIGERKIKALVDKKKVIIFETSIRSNLKLDDAKGTNCLPTATIFAELEIMGYGNLTQKLTFYKAYFSSQ
ncbi:hypothetical protein Tco_1407971, partial [Tanacetum coccineum]